MLTAVPSKAASIRMGQWKAGPNPIPIIAVALTIAGGRSASLIETSQCMKYGCVFHCFLRPIRWCAIKLAVVMTVQLHSYISEVASTVNPAPSAQPGGLRTVRILDDHSGVSVFPLTRALPSRSARTIGKALTYLQRAGERSCGPWHVKSAISVLWQLR
jgi:hypothetical protein